MLQTSPLSPMISTAPGEKLLDLVVPFTSPELSRAALKSACLVGEGLRARTRLIKIQVVPYPLEVNESPVNVDFLERQLRDLCGGVPNVTCEIRMARDWVAGLRDAVGDTSLVVIATPKRPWRTRMERLAGKMRKAGCQVVLVLAGSGRSNGFQGTQSSLGREAETEFARG